MSGVGNSWKWGVAFLISIAFVVVSGGWFFGHRSHNDAELPKPYVPDVLARAMIDNQEIVLIRTYGGFVDVGEWLELYKFPVGMDDSLKWKTMGKYYFAPIDYDDRFIVQTGSLPRRVVSASIHEKTIHLKFDKGADQRIPFATIAVQPAHAPNATRR